MSALGAKRRGSIAKTFQRSAFALFLFFAVLQAALFIYIWSYVSLQQKQRAEWSAAEVLAASIGPYLSPELDYAALRRVLDEALLGNLDRDIHLIDAAGKILLSSSRSSRARAVEAIALEPIQTALSHQGRAQAPLYGIDPYTGSYEALLSVAAIKLGEEFGYLYVNLDNTRSRRVRRAYFDSGVGLSLLLASTLASLAAITLGALLFAPLSRRLAMLMDGVRRYAAGDRAVRVRIEGQDDVSELGATFNQLTEKLNEVVGQLEQRDQLRRELVENIWHDIRGPVSSLRGVAELLARPDVSDKRELFSQIASTLSGNAEQLSRFLTELREVSDLDLGDREVRCEPVDLVELADEVTSSVLLQAKEQEIVVRVESTSDSCFVRADASLVARLLLNLVENALRYSDRGGEVVVEVNACDGAGELAVRDCGRGISDSELPHLFERRFRGAAAEGTQVDSCGLGLAIVQRIAEAHQTKVEVETAVGKGSRFSIRFPAFVSAD